MRIDSVGSILTFLLVYVIAGQVLVIGALRLAKWANADQRRDLLVFLSFSGPLYALLVFAHVLTVCPGRTTAFYSLSVIAPLAVMLALSLRSIRTWLDTWRESLSALRAFLKSSVTAAVFCGVVGTILLLQSYQATCWPIVEHDACKIGAAARHCLSDRDTMKFAARIQHPQTNCRHDGQVPAYILLGTSFFTLQGDYATDGLLRLSAPFFNIAFVVCLAWSAFRIAGASAATLAVTATLVCPFYQELVNTNQKEAAFLFSNLVIAHFFLIPVAQQTAPPRGVNVWLAATAISLQVSISRSGTMVFGVAFLTALAAARLRIRHRLPLFLEVVLAAHIAGTFFAHLWWYVGHYGVLPISPPRLQNVIDLEMLNLGIATDADLWLKGKLCWLTRLPDAALPFWIWLAAILVMMVRRRRNRAFTITTAISAFTILLMMDPLSLAAKLLPFIKAYSANVKYYLSVLPFIAVASGIAFGEMLDSARPRVRKGLALLGLALITYMALGTNLWGWKSGKPIPAPSERGRLRPDLACRERGVEFARKNLPQDAILMAFDSPRYYYGLPGRFIVNPYDWESAQLARAKDPEHMLRMLQALRIRYVQFDGFFLDMHEALLTRSPLLETLKLYGKPVYEDRTGRVWIVEIPSH